MIIKLLTLIFAALVLAKYVFNAKYTKNTSLE